MNWCFSRDGDPTSLHSPQKKTHKVNSKQTGLMCSRSNLHLAQCWWLRRRVKYWRLFQLERLHTPGGSWVTHRLRAKTRKQKTAARRRNGARARTRAQGAVYVPNGALARSLARHSGNKDGELTSSRRAAPHTAGEGHALPRWRRAYNVARSRGDIDSLDT